MRKAKQRKLKKKRKADRLKRLRKPESLAYRGDKFKRDNFIPIVYCTEVGIYESFVASQRQITDHDVRAALEWLIHGIRDGKITVPEHLKPDDAGEGEPNLDAVTWCIRRRWEECFEEEPFPGRDNLVGVLRTILGSIEVWSNTSPTSRGYLRYLEGFMGKLGVHCHDVSPELAASLLDGRADFADLADEVEEEESELLAAGRAWVHDRNADAGVVFRSMAREMVADGDAEGVAETCQQLIGETHDRKAIEKLSLLSIDAQRCVEPQSAWGRIVGAVLGQ
jgi:hypothetical protein